MNTPNALRVEEVGTLEAFCEVEHDWDDLCARAVESYPMSTHAWLRSWWNAFAPDQECHVVLVRRGETLVGAAPFVVTEGTGVMRRRRVLSFFANVWVDRQHFLVDEPSPEIVGAILDHVATEIGFDVVDLYPLADDSSLNAVLEEALSSRGWRYGVRLHLDSPYLELPSDWDGLMEELSSSFRQSVRRKIRKAEGLGAVEMVILRDESCIEPITAISLESWQQDVGTSMASTDQIRGFYRPIIEAAARAGTLRCAIMTVDGEPAAFEFNILHRQTLHNFKLGFNRKFGALSTGIVLKAHVLRRMLDGEMDTHVTEYDLMGTAEPYKLNWTKDVRSHSRYSVFAPTWDMKAIHWAVFRLQPFVRRKAPWAVSAAKRIRDFVSRRGE